MALEAAPNIGPHLPEESLEKYAFGRLPASELEAVEQHLLVCEYCRERLETEDNFAEAMQVLAKLKETANNSSIVERSAAWISQTTALFRRPPALAAVLAIVLLIGLTVWRLASNGNSEIQPVALAALRGGEQSMARAGAGRSLDLSIDLQAVAEPSASAGDYRLEVVNPAGTPLWTGTALATAGKLGARMDRHLSAGTYWVRLYAPSGKLLREFGLQVE